MRRVHVARGLLLELEPAFFEGENDVAATAQGDEDVVGEVGGDEEDGTGGGL